jgi:hypothetical protein
MSLLGGILGGGGTSASTTTKQNTGTASGNGSLQLNDAKSGAIHMGNETTIKQANKTNVTAKQNSDNKVNVAKGGTVNYITNTSGGDTSSMLDSIGNLLGKVSGGVSDGASNASGGISLGNQPLASTIGATTTGSVMKWAILAVVGFAVYFLFFRKKKSA